MKEKCHICKKVRSGKWALMFGVPKVLNGVEYTMKFHLCPDCFKRIRFIGKQLKKLIFEGIIKV